MKTRKTVLTALFASLIIVGAYIRFPLPPVPLTLQTLFVISSALLGGTSIALGSVGIYLLLGAIGFPVFTAGGGLGVLLGPTGGFLFGLLPAALLAGIAGNYVRKGNLTQEKGKKSFLLLCILFGTLATISIYMVGVPFLKYTRSLSWKVAIQVGMLPFLLGDTLKLIVSIKLAQMFAVRIDDFLKNESPHEKSIS